MCERVHTQFKLNLAEQKRLAHGILLIRLCDKDRLAYDIKRDVKGGIWLNLTN